MISKIELNDYDTEQTSNIYWLAYKLNEVIDAINQTQKNDIEEGNIVKGCINMNCPKGERPLPPKRTR